jgi:hypothetical protein
MDLSPSLSIIVASLDKNEKLFYITVLCVSIWITTVLFPVDIRHVAGLALGGLTVGWLYSKKANVLDDFKKITHYKLNAVIAASRIAPRKGSQEADEQLKRAGIEINRVDNSMSYIPNHLYKDPDLVNLLFSVLDFREYNHSAFLDTVWTLDNLIAIHDEIKIGLSNCVMHAEEAKRFADLALNHFNTFQLSIPVLPVVETKFGNKLKRLHLLVMRHMDDIYRLCKKQSNYAPSTRTGFDILPAPNNQTARDTDNIRFDTF